MNWNSTDFFIIGALVLFGLGMFYISKRFLKKRSYRRIAFIVVIILVLLVWVEMGVRIFGTPLAGN